LARCLSGNKRHHVNGTQRTARPATRKILPVVLYTVEQRIAKSQPDYWDYAILLELAVLSKDENQAIDYTGKALAAVREVWESETTVRNLCLICEAREKRQEESEWIKEIEALWLRKLNCNVLRVNEYKLTEKITIITRFHI